jgi:hypothetical protein
MKRSGLVRVTVLTVLATLFVQSRIGWFSPRSLRTSGAPQVRGTDPHESPAAHRWRHGLPAHWRACLLQR